MDVSNEMLLNAGNRVTVFNVSELLRETNRWGELPHPTSPRIGLKQYCREIAMDQSKRFLKFFW